MLWRFCGISGITTISNPAPKSSGGCLFCDILNDSADDEEKFILHRAELNFVILNIYPYISTSADIC